MILGAASVLLCGVSAYSALLRQHTQDYVTTPASGGRNSAVTTRERERGLGWRDCYLDDVVVVITGGGSGF